MPGMVREHPRNVEQHSRYALRVKSYRAEVHGHLIEGRQGDLGHDLVMLDGRIVSSAIFGGWYGASHFFELIDESGKARRIEARWVDQSKLGLGKYRMRISVDGIPRCEVEATPDHRPIGTCLNCGYPLAGLPIESGEVRCPECGRHFSAAVLGLTGTPPRST
jgi:hypothetical protein